jgi:hypothetical protein
MLMADQAGWLVCNEVKAEVTWDGDDARGGLTVRYDGDSPAYAAMSHFGCGVVTWNLPLLFRTPPGYDLLVRGPAKLAEGRGGATGGSGGDRLVAGRRSR